MSPAGIFLSMVLHSGMVMRFARLNKNTATIQYHKIVAAAWGYSSYSKFIL